MKSIRIREEFYDQIKKLADEKGLTLGEAIEVIAGNHDRSDCSDHDEVTADQDRVTDSNHGSDDGNRDHSNGSILEKIFIKIDELSGEPSEDEADKKWKEFVEKNIPENFQSAADFLYWAVWQNVCNLVMKVERLEEKIKNLELLEETADE